MSHLVSPEEALQGTYIDLEGSRTNPALLGVISWDSRRSAASYECHILDPELHPAAALECGGTASDLNTVARSLAGDLGLGRLVFAWSEYEETRLGALLDHRLFALVLAQITNAIPIAEDWMNRTHPGHPSRQLKKGERNALNVYLNAVKYRRRDDAAAKPAEGIRLMIHGLRRTRGSVEGLTEEERAGWRATLRRNFDDCNGMREVMLRVAGSR